jgi:hypothetical protein
MKKYLILFGCITSAQLWGHTAILNSYPLPEMEGLGFRPYPPHAQQIVDVYLVDEETWQHRLSDAKKRFDQIKADQEGGEEPLKILRRYWELSIHYDYALANSELRHILLGNKEGMEDLKNMDWAIAFDSIHPTHLHIMKLNREGYLREPHLWRAAAAALIGGRCRANSDHSDYTAPHDEASNSRPSTDRAHLSSNDHSDDETRPLVSGTPDRAAAYRAETDPYKPKSTNGLRKRKVIPQ